jgi:hypothetical protein
VRQPEFVAATCPAPDMLRLLVPYLRLHIGYGLSFNGRSLVGLQTQLCTAHAGFPWLQCVLVDILGIDACSYCIVVCILG